MPAVVAIAVVALFGIGIATGVLGKVATADREYDVPPERLEAAVRSAATAMPRWTLVGPGHYEARTAIMKFVDDVRVDISARPGGSRLRVRSESREGAWDLGTNGRRVRAFLAAVDLEVKR